MAWAQHVDADVATVEIENPTAGKRPQGSLGGVVDGEGWETFEGGDRAREDHGCALREQRQRFLYRKQDAAYVGIEGSIEMCLGDLAKCPELVKAGVRDN